MGVVGIRGSDQFDGLPDGFKGGLICLPSFRLVLLERADQGDAEEGAGFPIDCHRGFDRDAVFAGFGPKQRGFLEPLRCGGGDQHAVFDPDRPREEPLAVVSGQDRQRLGLVAESQGHNQQADGLRGQAGAQLDVAALSRQGIILDLTEIREFKSQADFLIGCEFHRSVEDANGFHEVVRLLPGRGAQALRPCLEDAAAVLGRVGDGIGGGIVFVGCSPAACVGVIFVHQLA